MSDLGEIITLTDDSVAMHGGKVELKDPSTFRMNVGKLVELSALDKGAKQGWARFLIRSAALQMGVVPSSIHDLYIARGRGEVPNTFTVPAMNLRVLSFDAAERGLPRGEAH